MSAIKRVFLGRPLASEDAGHQLLPKILALPVFASDALSSVAYATEEIMRVLILAGAGALGKSMPIALAVGALMAIVVTSYRQTVHAYPGGGGSYIVTKENVGEIPGLVAAAALLVDYILTVAVSIAAGAFALGSLAPSLLPHLVPVSLGFLALITLMNLRGTKESGSAFAIPTYAFVLSIGVMLILGLSKCAFAHCPTIAPPTDLLEAAQAQGFKSVGILLILRAFSSGATALTGVEAIADGVPAFRGRRPKDQAQNAATTLAILGVIAITMFMGITFLANRIHVLPSDQLSVVAQVAKATFGGGFGYAFVQIATALILVLAANTAYQDFPRLASILARDRFMPRQFINRGDRLVFSNGVVVLAIVAAALITVYNAEVTKLIQLYVVGVFTSFTLSQFGMVLRWRRLRPPGWHKNVALNGIGAITTGIVLVVVAGTKFVHGAWIVIVAVPIIVMGFKMIHRHYESVARQLRLPEGIPPRLMGTRAVVLVARVDGPTMRAVGYARALRPMEVRAIHIGSPEESSLVRKAWDERRIPVSLEIVPGDPTQIIDAVREYIRAMAAESADTFITVVLPESLARAGWRQYISRRRTLLLKAALLFERRVALTDVPSPAEDLSGSRGAITPTRVIAIVLVSAVHNATLKAVEYARSIRATEVRAVTFNIEPEVTDRVLREWTLQVDELPLEAIDSPYREVTRPLVRFIRQLRATTPDAVISVIVPEFVVRHWWHQFLHNQTPLTIKAALLFEPNVVVTSVPFHLD